METVHAAHFILDTVCIEWGFHYEDTAEYTKSKCQEITAIRERMLRKGDIIYLITVFEGITQSLQILV
jgi:hypothetical protein